MDENLKDSRLSRTQSLLNSFKMIDSLFVSTSNKSIVNLEIKNLKLITKN